MIDAHAHLYTPEIASIIDEVMRRFRDAGGTYVVDSATDPSSIQDVIAQAAAYPGILPTVGLHPEILVPGTDIFIKGTDEAWIDVHCSNLEKTLLAEKSIIGIGECGLDYYWLKKEPLGITEELQHRQKSLFSRQIEFARKHDLPLVIHCRDAMHDKQVEAEILKLLVDVGKGCVRGIFHSYTGSTSYLDDILGIGFYVSFNGIVTYKNAGNVRAILDKVPLDRILIETDAPLLVPNRRRSMGVRVCEPLFVDEVAECVAKRKGVTVDRLWSTVEKNFRTLFRLKV